MKEPDSGWLVKGCHLQSTLFRLVARLEQLRLVAQLYVDTRPIPKEIGRVIRRFVVFVFHVPSFEPQRSDGPHRTDAVHPALQQYVER
jgi:hypothetical protein